MLTIDLFVPFQFCIQRFINFVIKLGKFPSCLLTRNYKGNGRSLRISEEVI